MNIPKGWRLLEKSEKTIKGDKFLTSDLWCLSSNYKCEIAKGTQSENYTYIRKIEQKYPASKLLINAGFVKEREDLGFEYFSCNGFSIGVSFGAKWTKQEFIKAIVEESARQTRAMISRKLQTMGLIHED